MKLLITLKKWLSQKFVKNTNKCVWCMNEIEDNKDLCECCEEGLSPWLNNPSKHKELKPFFKKLKHWKGF